MSRLHANQPHAWRAGSVDRVARPSAWLRAVLVGIAVLLVASACADDSDNRQFASDPRTPQPTPTAEQVDVLEATLQERVRPVTSPEALVDRRGTPEVVYAEIGGSIRAVTVNGFEPVTGAPVAAFAASPSGDRVAVVVPRDRELGYDIEVYTADGELQQRFERVFAAPAVATPVADAADADGISLSWAPQGGRLLLARASGQLVDVRLDGTVEPIETRASLDGLVEARWSPRGDQIGVVFRDDEGYGRLALVDPSETPARVNVIAPVGRVSGERASVEQFAWKPHGDGVLFLQGNPAAGSVRNGQIVRWDQASNTTQVLAAGGQVGPTGSIRSFSIAPDGKAVAYVVDIRTPGGRDFGGLYVRSLTLSQVYRVPVGPDAAVRTFWWLGDGLAWAGIDVGEDRVETVVLRWIDRSGRQQAIGDILLVPPATPMASPVASPVSGTPAPSLVASPVGSPAATPVPDATPAD